MRQQRLAIVHAQRRVRLRRLSVLGVEAVPVARKVSHMLAVLDRMLEYLRDSSILCRRSVTRQLRLQVRPDPRNLLCSRY
jgi:hypothetical protein